MAIKQRQRAVQQRAEETREAILQAAVELFSTLGYDGVSIRAIENASGTKRGLVTYHFESKENLWKQVAARVYSGLDDFPTQDSLVLDQLDTRGRLRAYLTHFVYASARHPEVSRFIIQEGKQVSWRLEHIVAHFVRPRLQQIEQLMNKPLDAHTLYMFIGAATLVFDVEAECERLFGFNPRSEAFIREHATRVCDLMIDAFTD